jgi:VRR-NUC domain
MTEREWQRSVEDLAAAFGWRSYHTFDSRRSTAGFPDLVLVKSVVIFAELKTDTGRLKPAQAAWFRDLAEIEATCTGVEVYVWRPADFDAIVARLKKG